MANKMYNIYVNELSKLIKNEQHSHLMDVNPEYKELFIRYTETESAPEKQALRKKLVAIKNSLKNEWGYKKSRANRDKLIVSVLPMVMAIARRFYANAKGNTQLEDLIQAGNLGACVAADKYVNTPIKDGAKEAKFSTMAYMWIFKYVRDEAYVSATPFGGSSGKNAFDAANLTTTLRDTLTKDGEEFSNNIWDDAAMNKLMDVKEMTIASEDVKQFRNQSKKLFAVLNKNEKRILFMAYGIDTPNNIVYSQAEIAKMEGTYPMNIQRTIAGALRKLSYSTRNNVSGQELISGLAQLHSVDLSEIPEWTMEDTY